MRDVVRIVRKIEDCHLLQRYVELIIDIIENSQFSQDNTYINLVRFAIENIDVVGREWFLDYLEKSNVFLTCLGHMSVTDKKLRMSYEYSRVDFLFPILCELLGGGHEDLATEIILKIGNKKTFFNKTWDRWHMDLNVDALISKTMSVKGRWRMEILFPLSTIKIYDKRNVIAGAYPFVRVFEYYIDYSIFFDEYVIDMCRRILYFATMVVCLSLFICIQFFEK